MLEFENLKKYNEPFIRDYQDALNNVLNSGWLTTPYIREQQVC